jgi:hypothetical protein
MIVEISTSEAPKTTSVLEISPTKIVSFMPAAPAAYTQMSLFAA